MKRYEEIFWNEIELQSELLKSNDFSLYTSFARPTSSYDVLQKYKDFISEVMELAAQRGFKASELPEIGKKLVKKATKKLLDSIMEALREEAFEKGENWREVPGFEGVLDADVYGRIRNHKTGKILKGGINGDYISHKIKGKNISAHRAVAMAFPEITGYTDEKDKQGYDVNHKNEDKLDNHAENLEHISHKDNMNHGTSCERIGMQSRKKIRCIETAKIYDSVTAAAEELHGEMKYKNTKSASVTISNVLNGKKENAKGYHFEYIDE